MTTQRRRIVLLAALGLLVISLWRSVSAERDKRRIAAAYETAKQTLTQLEQERAELSAELVSAHGTIDEQSGQLTHLQQELNTVQDRLDETVSDLASLQREHEQLRNENVSLTAQFDSAVAEKRQLEAKLSSIKELKLAIRDIRRKMSEERWAAWRARVQAAKTADQERLASGNRGYVMRDGIPTIGASTKLHVRVLEPEPQ